jgi:hypothetical protein
LRVTIPKIFRKCPISASDRRPEAHDLPTAAPETIAVRDYSIEYRVETPNYMQYGLITGTNAFAQHLRRAGVDSFMLFAGAPVDEGRTRSFFVVGVRNDADDPPVALSAKLQAVRNFVEKLLAEDEPVLNTTRFKQGVMVASDRHLSRFFRYVSEFPRYELHSA